jgi:DNA-binding PadR family transcriptional regulator
VHDALRRCERRGLLSSKRVRSGRRYELTAAGRMRLRAERRFCAALLGVLLRS